jgi:large subunit ribosomal protein L7/L12
MAAKDKAKEEKKEEKKEVSKKVEKLVDEISELSVMELSILVNELKDKLGVEATPMAAAPAAAPAAGQAPAEGGGEEATSAGTVVLTGAGDNKIAVIKALREIDQSLGLKEAKDMTEKLPSEVVKDAKPEEAKEAADKLKEAGAQVELK